MDQSYIQALFFCAMQFINLTLLSSHMVPPSIYFILHYEFSIQTLFLLN